LIIVDRDHERSGDDFKGFKRQLWSDRINLSGTVGEDLYLYLAFFFKNFPISY
jgi:hypothetical protein